MLMHLFERCKTRERSYFNTPGSVRTLHDSRAGNSPSDALYFIDELRPVSAEDGDTVKEYIQLEGFPVHNSRHLRKIN